MKELNFLLKICCCPSCRNGLKKSKDKLLCVSCATEFPVKNGCPILLDKDSKDRIEAGKELPAKRGKFINFLKMVDNKFFPSPFNMPKLWFGKSEGEKIPKFLSQFRDGALILDLGSGTKRWNENCINLDIDTFENVDVVGDGHRLPFFDETFDCVISLSVLEHVNRPFEVADEIYRALKKGGYVFVSIPFVYAFHASEGTHQDFTRFTLYGIEELFSKFEKIEIGRAGPISMGVISILSEYLSLLITENKIFYWRLNKLFSWLLLPLRLLDPIIGKKSKSYRIASSFYFMGKK